MDFARRLLRKGGNGKRTPQQDDARQHRQFNHDASLNAESRQWLNDSLNLVFSWHLGTTISERPWQVKKFLAPACAAANLTPLTRTCAILILPPPSYGIRTTVKLLNVKVSPPLATNPRKVIVSPLA